LHPRSLRESFCAGLRVSENLTAHSNQISQHTPTDSGKIVPM
jgi:hypothetical protein